MFRHQSWIELHYWIIWNLNASMSPIGHIWTERMRKEIVLLGGLFVQSIIHDFRTGFYCIIVLKDNFFQMIGFFISTHHSSSIHDITSQKAVGFFCIMGFDYGTVVLDFSWTFELYIFCPSFHGFLVVNLATIIWSKMEFFLGSLQWVFLIFFSILRGFTRFLSHFCSGTILQTTEFLVNFLSATFLLILSTWDLVDLDK